MDHLQRWSRIFRSEETETSLSIWIPTKISVIYSISNGLAWAVDVMMVRVKRIYQPRSQGLSSPLPLVIGRTWLRLVTWQPVTQNFSTGVEPTNNFCRSQLQWKKGHNYTFEIFQSCWKLHTGQTKYIYWSITLISIPGSLFTTRTKTVSLFHVAWINLTAHCSLAK